MINKSTPSPSLDAPIPGQGMTAPLGGRPWQQPPKFSTPEKALSFYVGKFTQEGQVDQLLDILELGVPVDTLVDTVQLGGVMEGLHSVDVGIIIAPALVEAVSKIAEKAGVEYIAESQEVDPSVPSKSALALSLKEIKEQDSGIMKKEPEVEEVMDTPEEKPTGLMARRT
jgi:hypothetical protein